MFNMREQHTIGNYNATHQFSTSRWRREREGRILDGQGKWEENCNYSKGNEMTAIAISLRIIRYVEFDPYISCYTVHATLLDLAVLSSKIYVKTICHHMRSV